MCQSSGIPQYEVSSFAIDPQFYSQHNLSYWNGIDYIGIGPGAHGRITLQSGAKIRTFRILEPNRWMSSCEEHQHGLARTTDLLPRDAARESLVFGLRMTDGLLLSAEHEKVWDSMSEPTTILSSDFYRY